MKKILLILFSFSLVFSCVEKETETESNEQDNKKTIQTPKVIDTIYSDSSQYIGEWKDGKRNGQGTYIDTNGNKYVGEWQNGQPNGKGTYTWEEGQYEGDKYEGEWQNGLHHGQGTYTWGSGTNKGDVYVGTFINNKKTGFGTCNYANGNIYVGEWKDGNSHGEGTFTTTDGKVREGLFENGEYIQEVLDSNLNLEDVISDEDIVKE